MKKLLLSTLALALVVSVNAQRWDFTNWSAETVANLKAANALGTEWSDIEKEGGTTADIAKENCFWEVTAHGSAEGSPMTIGDVPVKELEGLLFVHTKARSLAIAVNYGDCTPLNGSGFGPYNGPQYLWFGGKNLNYIVIPNVRPGTEIKIGVESHKVTDARGLQLFVGRGNTGTQLKDIEGNDVAYPTTYQDQSWYLPEELTDTPNEDGTYDITLRNNNGCHLYYIQVGDGNVGESYNAAYFYAGETAIEALPLYTVLKEMPNVTWNPIKLEDGIPAKETLMGYDGVVLDASLPADNAELVTFLKENMYWQPVANFNAKLAEALGYGQAIESELELAWVYDPVDAVFAGFEGYADSVMYTITDGNVMPTALTAITHSNIDKLITMCSDEDVCPYADSVYSYVYNSGHNQYAYYGTCEDFGYGSEVIVQNLVARTLASKSNIIAVQNPTFSAEYQEMTSIVTIKSSNRNAVIYYTTDGSEPVVGVSPVYTEPLTLTEVVTVKAVAIADGYTVSETASFDVELFHQAKTPVVSCEGNGKTENAVITITSPEEGVDIWYNFTASEDTLASSKYTGPITVPVSTTITTFAVGEKVGLIPSAPATVQVYANVDKIRRDELAHFKVSGAGWNTLENLTLDGEPMTAWVSSNYYFSWGKTASPSYEQGDAKVDENGDPVMDEEGNIIYDTTEKAASVTLNSADPDWRLVSRGQVMVYQGNTLGGAIGDGSGYNPERAEDYIENLGTTGCIQFAGVASGDKPSAAIESTKKFAGPFNVVTVVANVGSGGRVAVQVSKDGETWEQIGDTLQTATVKRLYKKFEVSYEGTDEVYVRMASIKNSSQSVHDIYVFNSGEKSAAMKEELTNGIKDIVAPETVVAKPVKMIKDGQLVIVIGDAVYSISGARLK